MAITSVKDIGIPISAKSLIIFWARSFLPIKYISVIALNAELFKSQP